MLNIIFNGLSFEIKKNMKKRMYVSMETQKAREPLDNNGKALVYIYLGRKFVFRGYFYWPVLRLYD